MFHVKTLVISYNNLGILFLKITVTGMSFDILINNSALFSTRSMFLELIDPALGDRYSEYYSDITDFSHFVPRCFFKVAFNVDECWSINQDKVICGNQSKVSLPVFNLMPCDWVQGQKWTLVAAPYWSCTVSWSNRRYNKIVAEFSIKSMKILCGFIAWLVGNIILASVPHVFVRGNLWAGLGSWIYRLLV